ncbi:MAG: aspartate-semialdehyde dehydrogenase [Rubrivivax sp.]|nr:aspartate-semialdehyde dehydrogenase [Rubrivivax sp.]
MRELARPRFAIIGATGAVGRQLLRLIESRQVPIELASLAASERSAGNGLHFRGAPHRVQALDTLDFSGIDIAFFSAGSSVSREHARRAAAQGALVIDNTNAFRMEADTPLVVPQVNASALAQRPASGIVANPDCSTIAVVRLLQPVHAVSALRSVIACTYQAASGAGLTGLQELEQSSREVLDGLPAGAEPIHNRFAAPLGFNAVPHIDVMLPDGFTLEEQKMRQEARKILGLPALHVSATCVRVPVRNCHSAAVYVRCTHPLSVAQLATLWRESPEVQVYESGAFPTPRELGSSDLVHVGRIRVDPEDGCAFWFWVVSDNLLVGAALNAVQIVEKLVQDRAFDRWSAQAERAAA